MVVLIYTTKWSEKWKLEFPWLTNMISLVSFSLTQPKSTELPLPDPRQDSRTAYNRELQMSWKAQRRGRDSSVGMKPKGLSMVQPWEAPKASEMLTWALQEDSGVSAVELPRPWRWRQHRASSPLHSGPAPRKWSISCRGPKAWSQCCRRCGTPLEWLQSMRRRLPLSPPARHGMMYTWKLRRRMKPCYRDYKIKLDIILYRKLDAPCCWLRTYLGCLQEQISWLMPMPASPWLYSILHSALRLCTLWRWLHEGELLLLRLLQLLVLPPSLTRRNRTPRKTI